MSTPLLDRASALPIEAVSPLVDLVVSLADNKHALGLRFAEWCSSGPTIEAGVAATAMAQDELGHARVLYHSANLRPSACLLSASDTRRSTSGDTASAGRAEARSRRGVLTSVPST